MAKVTVIDDSAATVQMLESILRSGGHTVSSHVSSEAVEDRVALERPDVVLLDIVMPGRNGYEVLRALKRNGTTKDIPVVLVSSKGEETDIRWGKRQGAVDYITKPFTPDSVLAAVRAHT